MDHYYIIAARFPHLVDMFIYDENGTICGKNTSFTWNGYDFTTLLNFMYKICISQESHFIRLTKNRYDEFIYTLFHRS